MPGMQAPVTPLVFTLPDMQHAPCDAFGLELQFRLLCSGSCMPWNNQVFLFVVMGGVLLLLRRRSLGCQVDFFVRTVSIYSIVPLPHIVIHKLRGPCFHSPVCCFARCALGKRSSHRPLARSFELIVAGMPTRTVLCPAPHVLLDHLSPSIMAPLRTGLARPGYVRLCLPVCLFAGRTTYSCSSSPSP